MIIKSKFFYQGIGQGVFDNILSPHELYEDL